MIPAIAALPRTIARLLTLATLPFLIGHLPAADAKAPTSLAAERYPLEHYLTRLAEEQWRARAGQMAAITTAADVRARGEYVRTEILRVIGGLPAQREPLNVRITGTLDRPGYRIEKLIYESLPGCHVTANLYLPTRGAGPFPAVLGAAGHSMPEGKGAEAYQKAWVGLALSGYVVLAYDPPAQGERIELFDPATGAAVPRGGHISSGLQCLITGGTPMRYFLWDGIRGLDYLLTRPEVDPKRIGATGNSGGGTQSAFLAVVEPRLAAAAPSCYWTSWPLLWHPMGPQDSEQVIPGSIKAGLDYSDLCIAFAPKPITMLTATRDAFPVQGARTMHTEAKAMFALLGAEDRMGYFEYDDGHGWTQPRREAATAWFNRWFYGRDEPVKEPEITVETLETLRCTETGQAVTALRSKTMQMLNQEVAEALYSKRTLGTRSNSTKIREILTARLALPTTREKPEAKSLDQTRRADFTLETVAVIPEPGIQIRTDVIIPAGPRAARPAVIILREDLLPVDPEADGEVVAWRKAGYVLLVAQLRGLLKVPESKPYFSTYYRTAMRALLVGKTMAGMRVQDLLAVFDYASSQPDIAAHRITIVGRGNMGVIAQYAAALEPKIAHAVAVGTVISYMDVVRAPRCPEPLAEIIVPGSLLDYDLPDLVAVGAPGRLVLVNPISIGGGRAGEATAKSEYGKNVKYVTTQGPVTPDVVQ